MLGPGAGLNEAPSARSCGCSSTFLGLGPPSYGPMLCPSSTCTCGLACPAALTRGVVSLGLCGSASYSQTRSTHKTLGTGTGTGTAR